MLHQMLAETTQKHPHTTALVYDQIRLSYQELYAQVDGLSHGLASIGVKRHDCIALVLPNCIEFVTTFFAAAHLGAIALPLNPLLKDQEITQCFAECDVRVIVTDALHYPSLRQIAAALNPTIACVVIDAHPDDAYHFNDLILETSRFHRNGNVETGDVLYQFSSGSTGRPKRLTRTQANLVAEANQFVATTGVSDNDTILCVVPLFHAHGLGNCMLAAARTGATLVLLEQVVRDGVAVEVPFVARCERVINLIETEQITVLPGVPYIFSALADMPTDLPADLTSLKLCFSAGNFLPKATFDAFLQRYKLPVRQLYGCTEAGSVSINLDDDVAATWNSVGRPLAGIDIWIVDEAGRIVPTGEIGEIAISSPALTTGYANMPELNATAFRDGYFFTGDLGKLDAEGRLTITGRKKILIDTGGHKVDPLEVEDVLMSHPRVKEAVVVGVKALYGGEIVKAAVVLDGPCTKDELIAFCKHQLADFKVPRLVEFVEQIPKSPLGKILRKNLIQADDSALQQANTSIQQLLAAARPALRPVLLEEYLQQELSHLLQIERSRIHPATPLADVGLDSMTALQLKATLEQQLGLSLAATLVWNYPTIAALAHYLADRIEVGAGTSRSEADRQMAASATLGAMPTSEPIAIIGMSCRFPGGANTPEAFWQLLVDGVDAITEIPASRWDINAFYDPHPDAAGKMATRWGGFLDQVDQFDAGFFGISPREAEHMDPQQRLLLEVTWEALERAGQSLERIKGSQTGMFIGVSNSDYLNLQLHGHPVRDAYVETGGRNSFAAGRLSYLLDLRGPCVTLDTVCSSSLVAVHLACQSLRTGESRTALACAINLMLSPTTTVMASKWGMMAPDGRCKAFDARANGFVRSEGCGVVVLKRLSDALADGDPILALIRGSAINHDGRSTGLTAPNGQAQQAVIRQALALADVPPQAISYVETHGPGTALGDPIEVESLAAVVGQPHAGATQCFLGSVKTNLGHLEAAAGMAGLIKTVLALQHGLIPANLHFQNLNPHITLDQTRLAIATTQQPWPTNGTLRYAGVSSFGLSGTNAHVVLSEAPPVDHRAEPPAKRAYLVPISARSREALHDLAASYGAALRAADTPALNDLAYTASARRTHHSYRLAAVGTTADELAETLDGFLRGEVRPGLHVGEAGYERQRLVFVFPGQGAQWFGMGRQLLEREPVFRAALEQCDAVMRQYVDWSLLELLHAPADDCRLNEIDVIQPMLFALQVALAALWRSWGIVPEAVIGHSMGEIAAAHVAGALSLADAARIICRRSGLLHRIRGRGAMLAVEISVAQARELIQTHTDQISIAVSNSSRATVLAGDQSVLERLRARLEAQAVFCRWVKVDVAAHSPQVDPLRADLRQVLAGLTPRAADVPFYSTVIGKVCTGTELDSEYWVQNLRQPVLFGAAVQRLIGDGFTHYVEISPHPLLLPAITEGLNEQKATGMVVPSLQRETDEQATMLASLGSLYTAGHSVDWTALYPAGRCINLPTYPWQRRRFWMEPAAGSIRLGPSWQAASNGSHHPLLGGPLALATAPDVHAWTALVALDQIPYLGDHRVQDAVVMPAAGYIEIALSAAQAVLGPDARQITQLELRRMLVLPPDAPVVLQTVLSSHGAQSAEVQIFSRPQDAPAEAGWTLHSRAMIRRVAADDSAPAQPREIAPILARCAEQIPGEAHYRAMEAHDLHYGPTFKGIEQIWRGQNEAVAQVALPNEAQTLSPYQIHPALLDACLQTFTTATLGVDNRSEDSSPFVPIGFKQIHLFHHPGAGPVWAHVRLRSDQDVTAEAPAGDLDLLDADGRVCLSLRGMETQRLAPAPRAVADHRLSQCLYARTWQQAAVPPERGSTAAETWLILGDRQGLGEQLRQLLADQGHDPVLVLPQGTPKPSAGVYTVNPCDAAAYLEVFQAIEQASQRRCTRVVHLWSLDTPDDSDPAMLEPRYGWGSVLALTQAMIRHGSRARLWLVTRGAQAVGAASATVAVGQAPLWGLGLTIAQEHPELQCVRVDLSLEPGADEARLLLAEFAATGFEDQVALRADGRYVARLVPWSADAEPPRVSVAGDQPFRLEIATPGQLDHLALRATTRRAPQEGEIEIEVEAAGLNFKDVLLALDALPDQTLGATAPGYECAGRVVAVGQGVTRFEIGQSVIALADGSFSTHVLADERLVVPKPAQLTFAEAATIPVAFLTAFYALRHIGRLMPGERVLIHAATGGVGLAALQIAQQCGAEIFATAGSEEKRDLLRSLGVQHVFDSRSLSFVDGVQAATNGEGVDLVLNSLGGDAIPASFDLLRDYGRFIELGQRDYYQNRKLGLKPFLKNLSFTLLDLHGLMVQRPQVVSALFHEVMEQVAIGQLNPILRRSAPIGEARESFHQMARASHIGKIALTFERRATTLIEPNPALPLIRADGTYLITGGLGGVGLVVARWLATQGARQIALLGRSTPSAVAAQTIADLQAQGVTVAVEKVDVSDRSAFAEVLTRVARNLPPLRGVIHAAAVLHDATLLRLNATHFQHVLSPKMAGAWNLHLLTEGLPLDFFVMFSSVASLLGSMGQGNYAAANAFLDALAHARRARRLPALSINWGPWAQIGLAAAQDNRGKRLAMQGIASFSPDEGLELLGKLLRSQPVQVGVVAFNLRQWQQANPVVATLPLFDELRQAEGKTPLHGANSLPAMLQAAQPGQRHAMLEGHLREQIAQVLRLAPDQIGLHTPFGAIGFDSLLALELRNRLEASLNIVLSGTTIWSYPTIHRLVPYLAEKMGLDGASADVPAAVAPPPRPALAEQDPTDLLLDQGFLAELEHLSDDEVRRMLSAQ